MMDAERLAQAIGAIGYETHPDDLRDFASAIANEYERDLPMKCGHVLRYGSIGETVEDETPSKVCLRPATFVISAPGVRNRYRCSEHVKEYEGLDVPDLRITAASPSRS